MFIFEINFVNYYRSLLWITTRLFWLRSGCPRSFLIAAMSPSGIVCVYAVFITLVDGVGTAVPQALRYCLCVCSVYYPCRRRTDGRTAGRPARNANWTPWEQVARVINYFGRTWNWEINYKNKHTISNVDFLLSIVSVTILNKKLIYRVEAPLFICEYNEAIYESIDLRCKRCGVLYSAYFMVHVIRLPLNVYIN